MATSRSKSTDEKVEEKASAETVESTTNPNQQPVTVSNGVDPLPQEGQAAPFPASDLVPITPSQTTKVTPTNPTDGGDGTRPTVAGKLADNVWDPYHPLTDTPVASVSGGYQLPSAVPGTRTRQTNDTTASIASGLADI